MASGIGVGVDVGAPALRRSLTSSDGVGAMVGRLKLGGPALRRSPAPPGPRVVTEGLWVRDPGDDLVREVMIPC